MNVQEASFRDAVADKTSEQFVLDRSSFRQRTASVAAAAAADAEDVDRHARFPKAAIDAAREQKLLGIQIPTEFGGYGASIFDVTDMCYTLGRACASTAMIFAMHQTKVACLVRHGAGSTWHETLMRRVAAEQLLLASSTTEGQNGGNIRFSAAAVERAGAEISLVRNATVISYGAAGRRHRHDRAARQRRRRVRSGAGGLYQGRLHAGAQSRMGNARHARNLQRGFRAEGDRFGRADLSGSL